MRVRFAGTLNVRHIAKGGAELALLVGAVWTPVQTIHPGVLAGYALRERLVFVILVVTPAHVGGDKKGDHNRVRKDLFGFAPLVLSRLLPISSLFGHDSFLISRASGDDVQGPGQNIELLAVQRQHFAVDHDIDRSAEFKLHAADRFALGQGMLDMATVV